SRRNTEPKRHALKAPSRDQITISTVARAGRRVPGTISSVSLAVGALYGSSSGRMWTWVVARLNGSSDLPTEPARWSQSSRRGGPRPVPGLGPDKKTEPQGIGIMSVPRRAARTPDRIPKDTMLLGNMSLSRGSRWTQDKMPRPPRVLVIVLRTG